MKTMESPDEPISLRRAAQLAGLSINTLREQASRGRLGTIDLPYSRDRLTTRRLLHVYLMDRDEDRGRRAPLPAGYVAPE